MIEPRTNKLQLLQAFFESLDQSVVLFDSSGGVVCANPSARSVLGRPFRNVNDIPPGNPEICALGDDEQLLAIDQYPPLVALRTGSKVKNLIMGIFNPMLRERRWFSVNACPIYERDQPLPRLAYTVFTDITDQRKAHKELLEHKLYLALAERATSTGRVVVDFRTGQWHWSDEACCILGVDPATFTPTKETIRQLISDDAYQLLMGQMSKAYKSEAPNSVECEIKRPDGQTRTILLMGTLARDGDGAATGTVGIVKDITDCKIAETEKQELQTLLYHSQRLYSLGTVAGGIAHDLNNTLVPVVALSETLTASVAPDDPNRQLIELIREGGSRAKDLVAQVQAFARHEAAEYQPIDIHSFLQNSLVFIRAAIPTSITLTEDLNAIAYVSGNGSQLYQVLLNLVINAAQAIGDGPGQIHVSTKMIASEVFTGRSSQQHLCITVKDNGSGMPVDVKSRIFEPFFTTKPAGDGTGLGLSVVHEIVTSHGGTIHVKSAPGEGSQFDVFLPVAMA